MNNEKIILEQIPSVSYDPSITYLDQLKMSYIDLVAHLIAKYGKANGNYFLTETCKSKNIKITRGSEGLFCHHIDENKAIKLSKPEFAIKYPFAYQKAERLVYCDILEHLILHIKIIEEPKEKMVGIGGAALICSQINDCFSGMTFTKPFMIKVSERIRDKFSDYLKILQWFFDLIKKDPLYPVLISKESICKTYDGKIIKKIYDSLK